MKRALVLAMLSCMCVLFSGCQFSRNVNEAEAYSIQASISYGSSGGETQTKIEYDVSIHGSEEEITLIHAYDFVLNENYEELVLEHCVYADEETAGTKNEMRVKGFYLVDTKGLTKEELDEGGILMGITLRDDQFNEITTLQLGK